MRGGKTAFKSEKLDFQSFYMNAVCKCLHMIQKTLTHFFWIDISLPVMSWIQFHEFESSEYEYSKLLWIWIREHEYVNTTMNTTQMASFLHLQLIQNLLRFNSTHQHHHIDSNEQDRTQSNTSFQDDGSRSSVTHDCCFISRLYASRIYTCKTINKAAINSH